MDYSFSEEQLLLAETSQRAASDLFGPEPALAVANGDLAQIPSGWAALSAMGLTGLLVPEETGGSGGSLVDACIVAEALAAQLAPVPFVGTSIAAVELLKAYPSDQGRSLMAEIVEGASASVTLDRTMQWPPVGDDLLAWEWIEGAELVLPDGRVVPGDDTGPTLGVSDPLHALAAVPPLSSIAHTEPTDASRRVLAAMQIGVAAALTGTIRGASELAIEYVGQRKQYGRTIGSFQVVQHLCADLVVDLESSRSVLYGAAWTVENEDIDDAERAATIAKAWCGGAAIRGAEAAVQLLGGIGVTWESPAHLYLRQAQLYARVLGAQRSLLIDLGRQFVTV